jgi:hypothetical protein
MNNRYITITEGEDYRTIAKRMTDLGYKMNHATARNILLSGMKKFLRSISEELGNSIDDNQAARLCMRQDIHEVIGDILALSIQEENKKCPQEIQDSNQPQQI